MWKQSWLISRRYYRNHVEGLMKNVKSLSQDKQCSSKQFYWALPEWKSRALPLLQPTQWLFVQLNQFPHQWLKFHVAYLMTLWVSRLTFCIHTRGPIPTCTYSILGLWSWGYIIQWSPCTHSCFITRMQGKIIKETQLISHLKMCKIQISGDHS
jgi:hypothetical protein